MTEGTANINLTPFPVRVGEIEPIRIDFEAFVPPSGAKAPVYYDPAGVDFRVRVKYRIDDGTGVVIVMAEADFAQEKASSDDAATDASEPTVKPPYRLAVAAAASFNYDGKEMSKKEVTTWCEKGAFFVLSPYLRQLVFDVTARSGFPTITLPLVTVPILRDMPSQAE